MNDLNLQLAISTVIGLGDLAEDEIISKVLPFEAILENIKINLIDDRPPVNITSPGAVPLNVEIGKMKVIRDDSGVIHIQPDIVSDNQNDCNNIKNSNIKEANRFRELISLQILTQQLKLDNESLRKQLDTTEKQTESKR